MHELKYIYDCPLGITRFDKYFDYLRSVEKGMPSQLSSFALDTDRYVLRSDGTLHDAWISRFCFENNYSEGEIKESTAKLDLLHSSHEIELHLLYSGMLKADLSVGLQEAILRPVDLLVHEFTVVEPGVFQHLIRFDKGEWISIRFREFNFSTTPIGL
jgi:hypothetical protein